MPFISFVKSGSSLPNDELLRQIDVCSELLDKLEDATYEPSGRSEFLFMEAWRGYSRGVAAHGVTLCHMAINRHLKYDPEQRSEFVRIDLDLRGAGIRDARPPWLGNKWIHRSHRSQLITRYPDLEEIWPNTPERMPVLIPQIIRDNSLTPVERAAGIKYRIRITSEDLAKIESGELVLPRRLRYHPASEQVLEA